MPRIAGRRQRARPPGRRAPGTKEIGTKTAIAPHRKSRAAVPVRRLVDAAGRGDRDALEELYRIHFDRIYGYLHLTVGNRHDAEDLTDQTFVKMLESIDRFSWKQAPFSAWLVRIAHNLAMDHFRAGRRRYTDGRPAAAPALDASAEERALQSIGSRTMLAMIEGLSLDQQQVLALKFLFNVSNVQAAAILGKSEGAVKSLQHRALASLEREMNAR